MQSLLKKEVKSFLIKAIGQELYAHNMYKNFANQMQAIGYFGTQKYFLKESEDELKHYQILADYINDRGDVAEIPSIPAQEDNPASLKEAFDMAYEIELSLEKFYVKGYDLVEDELGDCITAQFLLQFLEIQRISVGEIKDILSMLKLAKEDSASLFLIDKKLSK